MLGGIFQKRKKIQELRAPSLQDIKKFREFYGRHADKRHVETPACFERSIYKAISCQKELHSIDFRQEDVTDPQIVALAETLVEMPMISSLDLRDNRITDDGAKALLEVLRLQIIAAKTPPKTDPRTKKLLPPVPVPEYTRYVTNVNLKGNEISAGVLQEMAQYTELLKREDKRLEIRAALNQIDRNTDGGVDEEDFKAVVKLLTGTEPSKKEVRQLMSQSNVSGDSVQNSVALENVLLAKCSSSPSKKAACPPWEALVQVRHAQIGDFDPVVSVPSRGFTPSRSPESRQTVQTTPSYADAPVKARTHEATGSLQTFSVQDVSTQRVQVMNLASPVSAPPPAPYISTQARTGSMSSLSVDDDGNGSSPRSRVDFGPPSSPPPPLSLVKQKSLERKGTNSNAVSVSPKSREGTDEGDGGDLGDNRVGAKASLDGSGSPFATRQGSADKPNYVSPVSPVSPVSRDDFSVDLASWRDDELFGDEDELSGHLDGVEREERHGGDTKRYQDETRSAGSRAAGTPSNRQAPSGSSNGQRRNDTSSSSSNFGGLSEPDGETGVPRSGACEKEDLSSLAFSDRIDAAGRHSNETISIGSESRQLSPGVLSVEEEEQDNEEERVESIVIDIMKDGKPRNIAKVIHTEFKRGLPLQEFPDSVPFRNLVALILSENGLRDLSLFKECRFPCTTVVDLSQNALSKLSDDELACFPKLQVVDLSRNRLKVISGLGKLYDVKALNLSENAIRSVINIEHLVQLQVLRLRANAITATSALRLLSLNKMLSHLDIDDNPIVETDDRQRRKVTAHILNIIPTLSSLGSVPIAGHHSKVKRKLTNVDSMGKSLLEHEEYPELRSTWASNACDILQIVQDHEPEASRSNDDDDDPYGDMSMNGTMGGTSPTRQKKMSREQQRQRDELRSKAVAYRSRDKAPPSPVKQKVSPFAFGPPQPPPAKKSPKKKLVKDAKLAQEQKRRSVQLSAPKHPPVDTVQLKQEQRRKSRPTFDVNMSVAERLQLVREKSARRASTFTTNGENGTSQRASMVNSETYQMTRPAHHEPALVMEIRSQNSPMRSQSIMEFRIEPLPARSPDKHSIHVDNQATSSLSPTGQSRIITADGASERKPSLKESSFLQSLAVSDFLNHAEEEISTASTALNVLLSICERTPSDLKKLSEYRCSLEALDILNERESQELFQQAKNHDDPDKVRQCTSEFEKLRTLKKCIHELLHKLEDHAPGSPTIRSYCGILRTNELRDIIASATDDHDGYPNNEEPALSPVPKSPQQEPMVVSKQQDSSAPVEEDGIESPAKDSPTPSLHSRLFASGKIEENMNVASTKQDAVVEDQSVDGAATAPSATNDESDEFDFLSSEKSMFDDDDDLSTTNKPSVQPSSVERAPVTSSSFEVELASTPQELENAVDTAGEENCEPPIEDEVDGSNELTCTAPASPSLERNERSHSATSSDITREIQEPEEDGNDDFDFDAELLLSDTAPVDTDAAAPVFDADDSNEDPAIQAEASEHGSELSKDEDEEEAEAEAVAEEETEGEQDWDATDTTLTEGEAALGAEEAEETQELAEEQDEQEVSGDEEATGEVAYEEEPPAEAPTAEEEEEVAEAEDEDDEEAEMYGDWEKGFDPNSNHYFWFNHATGESQWVPPEGWPYEVDTPFEEDTEQEEHGEEAAAEEEAEEEAYDESSAVPESPPKSSFEDEDDVFSDQDLPDFE